jgi:hypothetical protein
MQMNQRNVGWTFLNKLFLVLGSETCIPIFNLVLQGFVFVMSYCFIYVFLMSLHIVGVGCCFRKSVLAVQFSSLLQHLMVDIDGFWQRTKRHAA